MDALALIAIFSVMTFIFTAGFACSMVYSTVKTIINSNEEK